MTTENQNTSEQPDGATPAADAVVTNQPSSEPTTTETTTPPVVPPAAPVADKPKTTRAPRGAAKATVTSTPTPPATPPAPSKTATTPVQPEVAQQDNLSPDLRNVVNLVEQFGVRPNLDYLRRAEHSLRAAIIAVQSR